MLPFLAVMGAGSRILGGVLQAGEIEAATERRLRVMRLQQGQERGDFLAAVGGTGVEQTSGTIQSRLNRMQAEWDLQMSEVKKAGGAAETNSLITGFAGGATSLASGLYQASKVTAAFGQDPSTPDIKPAGPLAGFGADDPWAFDWNAPMKGERRG